MQEPGEPGSSAPGLTESLVTLGKTPGLHEPIIPGGTRGLSVALGIYSLNLGTWGASVQGRMVDLASAPLCSWFTCFCH